MGGVRCTRHEPGIPQLGRVLHLADVRNDAAARAELRPLDQPL
jgi:hypothetical protein